MTDARTDGGASGRAPGAGRLGGVVLAAGAGTRLGRPKALVELDGDPLVVRAARLAATACDEVVVVAGAASDRVTARMAGEPVVVDGADLRVVVNDDWASGMGSSLRVGLDALRGRCGGALVLLVDQPGIVPAVLERLVEAWRDGAEAVVATFGGRQRPPALLDATVWDEVLAGVEGDRGARRWLRANPDRVTAVACDQHGDPVDVDTPADLERVRRARDGRTGGTAPSDDRGEAGERPGSG